MPADPARARDLFLAAADLPLDRRGAFLTDACGADADLRAEVEALLAGHADPASILDPEAPGIGTATFDPDAPPDSPAAATADSPGKENHIGAILAGKYKLIEEIGEGGMGSVYLARQTEPVKRTVAVKVIKAGMDSKAVLARFEAERQALAILDHPNIARVLDAGSTDNGRPFFVMELVKGMPITEFCDARKLTPRQRLELFVPVCQAIQHAHQKGIIHRDIKPSNVLVALYDDRPVPKVIDFGVAKAAGEPLTDRTLMTGFGTVVGTPEYMSPEQASLNNVDVDTRSDVYALGVLLYELLTGTTPVDRKSLGKAAVLEVLRIVREVEAPRPSAKLSTSDALPSVAAARGTEPAQLSRLLRGELDWVVLKALEKDRTRRYETANGLARDIQRYLADELVEARPPSSGYRLKKFVRRHRPQLALAGVLALLVLGGVSVAWWRSVQAQSGRERDARNAEAVATLLDQCEGALTAGDPAKAEVALDAARKRAGEGGATGQADRLDRLAADLALLRDLDQVDHFRWTWAKNQFPDAAAVAMRSRDALARFGADPEAAPADAVATRVSGSVVKGRIVSALDRMLLPIRLADLDKLTPEERKRYTPQMLADAAALGPLAARARAVLRLVDPDPYRDAVRDAVHDSDRPRFLELVGQPAAREQPPAFVEFVSENRAIPVALRRELLQAAVSRRFEHAGLLMAMGNTFDSEQQATVKERLRWYQAAVAASPTNAAAHNNLAIALLHNRERDAALACCLKAIELDPKLANAYVGLGNMQVGRGQVDEGLASFRKAVELDPKNPTAHHGLGSILSDFKRDHVRAIECFKTALELDPKNPWTLRNMGIALMAAGRPTEALPFHRKAVEIDPKDFASQESLGSALLKLDQVDEAIVCFRKALELGSKFPPTWHQLGNALLIKGEVNEAIVYYRKVIEDDPKEREAYANLGLALCKQGLVDEGIAAYKKAIALDPTYPFAHANLGNVLAEKGRLDEAIASFQKAVALDPKNAGVHFALGNALLARGRLDEAIASLTTAVESDPTFAEAHCNLSGVLARRGRFAEALAAVRRGHELGSKRPDWPYPSADWVRRAEADAAAEAKLVAFLKGELRPADGQARLDLAVVAQAKGLPHTAAGLYAAAFAAEPKLADDLQTQHRYNAASVAALAAAGPGEDAPGLDDAERARLRRRALDWLHADLALYAKRLDRDMPAGRILVRQRLPHWQRDTDLAVLRGAAALAKLPADEQLAFAQLWADVTALLLKAQDKGSPGPPPVEKPADKKPNPAPLREKK